MSGYRLEATLPYDFDEHATTADVRIARNWEHGLRTAPPPISGIDTGSSGASLFPAVVTSFTLGGFVTLTHWIRPRIRDPHVGRSRSRQTPDDARSWTFTLDGRRSVLSGRRASTCFLWQLFRPARLVWTSRSACSCAGQVTPCAAGTWDSTWRNQFIGTVDAPHCSMCVLRSPA